MADLLTGTDEFNGKVVAHSERDAPSHGAHILIRALTGGHLSQMGNILTPRMKSIKKAWQKKDFLVNFEELTQDDVKNKLKWSMVEAIDWLLKADVHFILCHPHQGCVAKTELWTIEEIYKNVNRLACHIGFPCGNKLKCPVFTQNKFVYIENLDGLANPTLRIDLIDPDEGFTVEAIKRIAVFMDTQKARGYESFIAKKGYVTNEGCKKHLITLADVLQAILRISRARVGFGFYPYVLIQPQMSNYFEAKIVCWNGRAMYIWLIKEGAKETRQPTQFSNKCALFAFAESAIQILKCNCPAFICDGLTRVDIFVDDFGDFKVNEIESLEARYLTDHSSPSKDEIYVRQVLPHYWIDVVHKLIEEAIAFNQLMGKYDGFEPPSKESEVDKKKAKR